MLKKAGILALCLAFFLFGCTTEKYNDNQVYVIESGATDQEENFVGWIDVKGQAAFYDPKITVAPEEILLTVASDEQSYYVMVPLKQWDDRIVKGPTHELVSVWSVNVSNGERTLVVDRVPFISKVAWNNTHEMVVFNGGQRLTIYDAKKEKLILQQALQDEEIMDFFWSPIENNKLYIEQPQSTGGGVYYVDPQKKVELYETKEKIFYKAVLDQGYYYATQWRQDPNSQEQKEALYTVLVDDQRQVAKVVSQGRYKDSYLDKVLTIGDNNYGLYYIDDINQVSNGQYLSQEYIYDAKFIAEGNIAYIVGNGKLTGNGFQLVITDGAGKERQRFAVSGSSLALSLDGKQGYISGMQREQFDLVNLTKVGQITVEQSMVDAEFMKILQGAASSYSRLILDGDISETDIKAYFIDHQDPSGVARSELLNQLKEDNQGEQLCQYQAVLSQAPEMSTDGNLVTCWLDIEGTNGEGHSFKTQVTWDMVREGQQWAVFGFSTFNLDAISRQVLMAAKNFLTLQNPELAGDDTADIVFDQVQLWQKENLGLSVLADQANMAKVTCADLKMTMWLKRTVSEGWLVQQLTIGDQMIYNDTHSE